MNEVTNGCNGQLLSVPRSYQISFDSDDISVLDVNVVIHNDTSSNSISMFGVFVMSLLIILL